VAELEAELEAASRLLNTYKAMLFGWDCQDFRVRAGIMGKKESHYVTTQRACDTE